MKAKLLMRTTIFYILMLSACCNQDCLLDGGDITLDIFRDGNPIITEEDAIITLTRIINGEEIEDQVFTLIANSNQLNIFIQNAIPTNLSIDGVEIGQFFGRTDLISEGRCCDLFDLTTVDFNGTQICNNNCNDVIRIDL